LICGIILSGGLSRRFQKPGEPWTDKALYSIYGKLMIEHLIDKLSSISPNIIVAAGSSDRVKLYSSIVRTSNIVYSTDDEMLVGPLSGLYSSLKLCTNSIFIALPNDTPYIPLKLLEEMIELVESYDIVSPILPNGLIETTIVAGKVDTARWILEYLRGRGRSKVADLHRGAPRIYLINVKSRGFKPEEFKNINRREDIEAKISDYPEGPLEDDVEIKREFNVRDVNEKNRSIIGSLWGTLLLGGYLEEFKLYTTRGAYMLAAYTLEDSPNHYERALGKLIIESLKPL